MTKLYSLSGRSIAMAFAAIVSASISLTGAAHAQVAGLSNSPDIYKGCEKTPTGPTSNLPPSEKILVAAGKTDASTERIFKSFSLEEIEELGDVDSLCWSRLDGLWREKMRVSHDKTVETNGWASVDRSTTDLAHGIYTEPQFIMIDVSEDSNSITLRDAIDVGARDIKYESNDGVTTEELLATPLKEKVYKTRGGPALKFSLSRTGRPRIKIGEKTYERPKPKISNAQAQGQENINEIFTVAYNAKNLGPTRQGYNVVKQDPKNFSDNGGLRFLFAEAEPKSYYIEDQMTVPLGLELIPIEGRQGNIIYDRLVSSASAYQEETKMAFGVNVGIEKEFKRGKDEQGDGKPGTGRTIGASFGYNNAREEAKGFSNSNTVATVTGHQRYKKFAFVRDHAYSNLSSDFIDAIYDAVDTGDYRQIIDDFGTHYPYAVTYGSSGQLRTSMTEETFNENYSSFKKDSYSGGFTLGPINASVFHDTSKATTGSTSTTNKFGVSVFTAIGGNGSWDQNGFVAGDPAPILMDLRPIDQLLSPMNFPDEPEIYEDARDRLNDTIFEYLTSLEALSSENHFRERERHKYRIELVELACLRSGAKEKSNKVQIKGQINMRFSHPDIMGREMKGYDTVKHETTKDGFRELVCPLKSSKNLKHSSRTREFTVWDDEVDQLWFQLHVFLEELDWGLDAADGAEIIRRTPSGRYPIPKNMWVGRKLSTVWEIPRPAAHPDYPKLRITVHVSRLQ